MNDKLKKIIRIIPLTILYFIFYKIFSPLGVACGECFWNSHGKTSSLILTLIFIIGSYLIISKYSTPKNQTYTT